MDENVIIVKVGGKEHPTYIDENGVQRFFSNSLLCYMFDHDKHGNEVDKMDPKTMHTQMLDLNALAVAYQKGKFDKREYAEMNMGLGYSVSGFADLSSFQDWEIENPLWNQEVNNVED